MYCGSSSVVEHHLAMVGVAGSNPVFRSIFLSSRLQPLDGLPMIIVRDIFHIDTDATQAELLSYSCFLRFAA